MGCARLMLAWASGVALLGCVFPPNQTRDLEFRDTGVADTEVSFRGNDGLDGAHEVGTADASDVRGPDGADGTLDTSDQHLADRGLDASSVHRPDAPPDASEFRRSDGSLDTSSMHRPDALPDAIDAQPDASACRAVPEQCNGIDDDCDGVIDDVETRGEPCRAGVGACASAGILECEGDALVCQAESLPPGPESPNGCNGIDDDCDGAIDEVAGLCGPYIVSQCTVWLGQSDGVELDQATQRFGDCPEQAADNQGATRCTSTRGDERFAVLELTGDVDASDALTVTFTCTDPAHPEVARWIETHCAVFLGHADANQGGPLERNAWGVCPQELVGEQAPRRCTSSGFDGRFRPMQLVGDVGEDDDLAIAFVCRDPDDPDRAAAVASSVEVLLAWSTGVTPHAGELVWGGCQVDPFERTFNTADARCDGSWGDQRFHRLDLGADVGEGHELGVALRPISPPGPEPCAAVFEFAPPTWLEIVVDQVHREGWGLFARVRIVGLVVHNRSRLTIEMNRARNVGLEVPEYTSTQLVDCLFEDLRQAVLTFRGEDPGPALPPISAARFLRAPDPDGVVDPDEHRAARVMESQ